ncbi:MAG: aspartate--tRNA ligase [Patescibacteria group bacterium]
MSERNVTGNISRLEGDEVTLCGWVHARRDHGKIIFIDLRDREGLVQVVLTSAIEGAADLRLEFVVKIKGLVKKRPASMVNEKLPNGHVEVEAKTLEILNVSRELPIPVDTDGTEISEEVRMKYRYLDLRRERLKKNLIVRHNVIWYMRDFLSNKGFIEIETPILTKSTPEGARDYLVPSRIQKGDFYALPQSPQQYKQLLMVAGMEKYFQVARCFRDEDTRGDRQPEFTQLDIEMSFITQEEILNLVEELFLGMVTKLFPEKHVSGLVDGRIPRMKYKDAMAKYGSDKPDLREDKTDPHELAFVLITDFPMFEKKDDGTLGAVHHPFTLPTTDTSIDPSLLNRETEEYKKVMEMLESEEKSLELLAYQYDLVLNGYEIGGGSIRTYDSELLAKVFERLGNKRKDIEEKFGHILSAFQYGVPPHGGIAPGIDRFIMILQNEPNIREVIAFPKTGDGRDPMMGAPSPVDPKQLDELGLSIKKK